MAEIVISIVAKASECLVKPVLIRPLRLIFCFERIVDDFRVTSRRLRGIREGVGRRVQLARNYGQVIHNYIEEWTAAVDAALSDVQQKEEQLTGGNRNYRLRNQLRKITSIMKKLCEDGNFELVLHPVLPRQDMGPFSYDDFIFSLSAALALDKVMEALLKDDIYMVGLYGMGGSGKTSLATRVQREVTRLEIFDHVVMVTVSQDPKVIDIQNAIAEYLGLELKETTKDVRSSRLNQRLKAKKILFILDDVWEWFNLAWIGIYGDECKGSKFLFTTRRMDVCTSMGSETNIQLNLLSETEAHTFFKKKVGLSNESELNEVAKQVVEECKGLPIALATVGAALRNKGECEWREALDKLKHARLVDIYGINVEEKNAYKCLQLSYDYLKHSTVQFTILLCSLFPEDHKIELEDLARCVFGMELFERVETIEDARRKVRVAVQFLKDSSLLLGTDDEKYVKMHDMVRDVVLWIGGKEPTERSVFTVRNSKDMKELIKRKSFQNCRAISFMADSLPALSKYELVCPNLEIILIFGGNADGFVFELPDEFFRHMKFLRVLNLSSAGKWTKCRFAMPRSLENLTDLRTLILKYCECLNSYILRELGNLEILSLEGSNIDCGVEVVMALKKLRLLDLSPLSMERVFPSNVIEALLKLEELYDFYFGECVVEGPNNGGSLSELELLSNLVGLFTKVENVRCFLKDFCFKDLQRYNIHGEWWDRGRRGLVLEGMEDESVIINTFKELLPAVQELYLKGVKHMYSLSALYSRSEGFLRNLETLEIEDCKKMKWVFEFQGNDMVSNNHIVLLQLLKILRLRRLPALEHIGMGPSSLTTLTNLSQLEMTYCSKLTCIFPSVSNLQQLEIFTVRWCGGLEEIVSNSGSHHGDEDGSQVDDFRCYPRLRRLQIEGCAKLKTIFPSTKSSSRLPKLQQLQLYENAELEHVFGHETHLEVQVECPCLEELSVRNCPKMANHFAASHLQASSSKALKQISLDNNNGVEEMRRRQDDVLPQSTIICFSPLQRVDLISSNKLKHVSTTSLVRESAPSSSGLKLEQKGKEVEEFYLTTSPKQPNISKGSSVEKDNSKEKNVPSIKKQQQIASRREAAAAKRMQDLMRQFDTILHQLTQHEWAWPLLEPVDVKGLGLEDYYKIIDKPMDFSTIKNQMEVKDGSGYKNVREICADVRFVLKNAMKYNEEKSDVYVMAKTMLAKFEEKWLQILPKVTEEEKRREEEEEEAKLDMQLAQEAAHAEMARDISKCNDNIVVDWMEVSVSSEKFQDLNKVAETQGQSQFM